MRLLGCSKCIMNNPHDLKAPSQKDSIECKEAHIQARKIDRKRPRKNEILDKLVYITKLNRGAKAEIAVALNPKIPKIDENAMLDEGSTIRGFVINCLSTRPIPPETVKKGSASHRAQFIVAREHVHCKVFIRFND